MEPDALFFRRRIAEELAAAERAVTGAARLRRYQLVEAYLWQLERRGERLPVSKDELADLKPSARNRGLSSSDILQHHSDVPSACEEQCFSPARAAQVDRLPAVLAVALVFGLRFCHWRDLQ